MANETHKLKTVEYAPIGIWKLDDSLNVVEANLAVSKQLSITREELLGKNILEILPSLPRDIFGCVQQSGQTLTRKNVCMLTSRQPSEAPRYWEISLGPILNDDTKIVGFVLSTVEVTERERLIQQREDFIAHLSHNLKTPLIGAERTLESMLEGVLGQLTPEQEEVLRLLKSSNKKVLAMLQDLIEVYKYETGSAFLTFESIDVHELVNICINQLKKYSQHKHIQVRTNFGEGPLMIFGDWQAIKRLCSNLLDNAIKFTPEGGLVEISCLADSNELVMKVKDNGVGMTIDDQDRVFQRFWTGERGKQYAAVTGLGLYLCGRITAVHGGKISVESQPHTGTTFSVRLPSGILNR